MRIVLLIAFASLLSITASAQDESEAKSPLELKLSTNTPALCIGSPLVLQLEVTNISQTDVEISEAKMWMQFSYSYLDKDRGGGMGLSHSGRSIEKKTVLSPGMNYQSTHEFSLDFDFFKETGNYKLETALDSIYSNEVTFELYDCGKAQEVKEQK